MEYEATIGLEIHTQLRTKSKMWCNCANQYGAEPNTLICPVCLGQPGVLPVANEEALKQTALAGFLLNCEVPKFTKFDRKNYFYPDAPKDYQITQFDRPSTKEGFVEFEHDGGIEKIRINRAHLEEDLGKCSHFDSNSGVDFNRAGVPLLEIVTEPDLTSADMAYDFLNALIDILRYGGVSECDMEKGMVRCDVNVSIRPKGQEELGEKVEIKNMNSFSGARKAIRYEIKRQTALIEKGGTVSQETRRWDDEAGISELMRSKEDAHDYRYFPEPDLMPFEPDDTWLEDVRARVVELPLARKNRFIENYSLPATDAETFVQDVDLGNYFDDMAKDATNPKTLANWVINNIRAKLNETDSSLADLKFEPKQLLELLSLVESGKINSKMAQQDVFPKMFESGEAPSKLVEKLGGGQVSDTAALEKFCQEAIDANPGPADEFRNGKEVALNFLKGQVMKLSRGKANPALVGELLTKMLKP